MQTVRIVFFGMMLVIFLILLNYEKFSQESVHGFRVSKVNQADVKSQTKAKTVVVTAVNANYFASARNLIGSIHFWEPKRDIVVYNLGLSKDHLDELSQMCRVTVNWPGGIPSYIPKHTNNLKQYAWKPFVIKDAVDRYNTILWVDGGSNIRGPMDRIDEDLERDGFFIVGNGHGFTSTSSRTHQGMFDYLHLPKSDFLKKEIIYGTYQGYIKGNSAYFRILQRLLDCASHDKCISPPGSNLNNHRYDQSALSLMVHTSGFNITRDQKHYDLESWERKFFNANHTIASERILYTGRRSHLEYVQYIKKRKLTLDCVASETSGQLTCPCTGSND